MGILITAVLLWAAVGVGSRPVTSPLNDAKVECIIQETLNEDGSQHECVPKLTEELDEVQRHQGLLRELQKLADDEREREHEDEREKDYEYNLANDESDFEQRDEEEEKEEEKDEADTVKKTEEEKEEGETTRKRR
ncbi:parathymosin [Lates calcarifer]|uniref:Parathymosin n=1 Tax=Lates calcarifer TaxID=8187 RepID=A0AAJ7LC42_LATCA|nr:parathymosin [Lates calcarifer]